MSKANEKLELDLRRASRDLAELADTLRQMQSWTSSLSVKLEGVVERLGKHMPWSKK